MSGDDQSVVWGLWNQRLGEWFNPGTSKPYYRSRAAAERMVPMAMRQYPYGTWETREYPLFDEAMDLEVSGAREGRPAGPALTGPAA